MAPEVDGVTLSRIWTLKDLAEDVTLGKQTVKLGPGAWGLGRCSEDQPGRTGTKLVFLP